MIKVGIIGCGFVGGALKAWLEENNKDAQIFVSDPPKGYNDDLSQIDIAFLQIHVPTEDDGTQDLTLMKELIRGLPEVPVFVRTTILPGTSDRLSKDTLRSSANYKSIRRASSFSLRRLRSVSHSGVPVCHTSDGFSMP